MAGQRYLSLFLFGVVLLTLASSQRLWADFTEVTRPDPALIQTAFPRNEKIIYELTWLGIKAGTVSITIRQKESANWSILGEARSSPLFSLFFPAKTYKLNRPSHNELTSFLVLRTLPLKAGRSVFKR